MTHGHELREEIAWGDGGGLRGKNWDNCNSIIDYIYIYLKRINSVSCTHNCKPTFAHHIYVYILNHYIVYLKLTQCYISIILQKGGEEKKI